MPMSLRSSLVNALCAVVKRVQPAAYSSDGLVSLHDHTFINEPRFAAAYKRGVQAIGGVDTYRWHWRVHIGLWAARMGALLDGAFVECGVNRGFLSSAIMEYLSWNSLNRDFYLLDTFSGINSADGEKKAEVDVSRRNRENIRTGFYVQGVEKVRENFAEWKRAKIIVGAVPGTLEQIAAPRVAYLHIDMNNPDPEVAALRFLWDRLAPGAPVLLDDYAYMGFSAQKRAMDGLAEELGLAICALPTGQGLLFKPT